MRPVFSIELRRLRFITLRRSATICSCQRLFAIASVRSLLQQNQMLLFRFRYRIQRNSVVEGG